MIKTKKMKKFYPEQIIKTTKEKTVKEIRSIAEAFTENVTTLIISAFGLAAALAWNDAIKSAIDTLLPQENTIAMKFFAAAFVTILSVAAVYYLSKFKLKKSKKGWA